MVHGGEEFAGSVVITDKVVQTVEACNDLAPLHNPANLIGIAACKEVMPSVPMVGVFDTAFHQTMPKKAYLYGLPYEYYEKYKVRRYGFHGTSHDFVSRRAAEILGKDRKELKIIVCHLGNGASVTAVKNGESVDTSMGLTPLEGLIMGTRSGDLDPAIITFLAQKEGISAEEVISICNKRSGVLGLSGGFSSDFRDLAQAAQEGNEMADTALEAYAYRVGKYIGAYAAAMNGVDVICFTAGLGENGVDNRANICQYLGYLGVEIDKEANQVHGKERLISTPNSKVHVYCLPTNEELAIARETVALVK
jgi:acetate kinase